MAESEANTHRAQAMFLNEEVVSWPDNLGDQGGRAPKEATADGTAEGKHAELGKLRDGSACVCHGYNE